MRSPVVAPPEPRVRLRPPHVDNDVVDAVDLSSAYGLTPDDWQADVLEDWLGRRRDGKWSASTCGLAVPRQNGKNGAIEVRELYGMVVLGEKFLHTAHEVKTARKAFLRLAGFFENERQYPELAALVKEIRRTNGQEAIVLDNGGSVEFIARSKGSGRGFTVDVLVMDEAQQLSDDSLAALLPTISAAPLGNPQQIYTGTPPSESMNGDVWTRVRKAGQGAKNARLAWTDFGLEGPLPDCDDRNLWAQTNPALGTRLHADTILDERVSMDDETFARERLGWWGDPDVEAGRAIPSDLWAACLDQASRYAGGGRIALGLHISGDRATAYLFAVGKRADGLAHVEMFDPLPTSRAVPFIREKSRQHRCRVYLDSNSHANSLVPALDAERVPVELVTLPKYAQACGMVIDSVANKTLRHIGQPDLDRAVAHAGVKETGRDSWVWDGQGIAPLKAMTLALWGYGLNKDVDLMNTVW